MGGGWGMVSPRRQMVRDLDQKAASGREEPQRGFDCCVT